MNKNGTFPQMPEILNSTVGETTKHGSVPSYLDLVCDQATRHIRIAPPTVDGPDQTGKQIRINMKFMVPILNSIYLRGVDSIFVEVWGPLPHNKEKVTKNNEPSVLYSFNYSPFCCK